MNDVRVSVGVDSSWIERETEELQHLILGMRDPLGKLFGQLALDLMKHAIQVEEITTKGHETLRLGVSFGWYPEFRALALKVESLAKKKATGLA